jgi:hypothetical protein
MGVSRGFWMWFATLLAVFVLLATSAFAYDLSGTVANGTAKIGRIYLNVQGTGGGSTGLGVSIPAPGPYTIRGVQNGTYTVRAFMDTQVPEGGTRHATDPVGQSTTVTVNNANVSGADLNLSDPSPPMLQSPQSAQAMPGDGKAIVMWDAARTTDGAESTRYYTVYWSDTPNPGPTSFIGKSPDLPSTRNTGYLVAGLTNGKSYYFSVTARLDAGTTESISTNVNGGQPVAIGPPAGGYTVSGTVDTSAITKGGNNPLWVAIVPDKQPTTFTYIASPADLQAYSIPGVPPGNYHVYAILDMNNNGLIDAGDYMTADSQAIAVSVTSADGTGANFALSGQPAEVSVGTNHWMDSYGSGYSLNFQARGIHNLPVNVSVSGPQIPGTMDMAADQDGGGTFRSWTGVPNRPQVSPPDSYSFNVAYADGSSTGSFPLTAQIMGVMDSAATPSSPSGSISSATPTFTWSAPANPPATQYFYNISLDGNGMHWESQQMPASQLSATYNFDGSAPPLAPGAQYTWHINVSDGNGNSAGSAGLSFTIGNSGPVSYSGSVNDTAGTPVAGAFAEVVGYAGVNATTATDGTFTINGIPTGTPFSIGISKDGYQPIYTNQMTATASVTAGASYTAYTPTEVAATGVIAGKGAIKAKVVDAASASGISGAVVTANSAFHPGTPYTVNYFNGTAWGGSATFGNGAYLVTNVDDGDTVTVTAAKSGWNFVTKTFQAHADAVSESRITGTAVSTTGSGAISASPMSVSFSNYSGSGSYPPQNITISNIGTANLNVQSWSMSGDTASFTVLPGGPNPCPSLPFALAPGQGCSVTASYYSNPTGSGSATLMLNSDDPKTPTLNIGLSGMVQMQNGSISGRATNSSGGGLGNVNVQLFDATTGAFSFSTYTDMNGNYSIVNVPDGSYKVQFSYYAGSSSLSAWYDGAAGMDTAKVVQISASSATTGVNAVFALSSITGHVVDASGQGVCGASINANGPAGSAYASTAADGSYTLSLPSGDYTLSFSYYPGNSNCGTTNYPQYSSAGIPVSVTTGVMQDFSLPPYFTVSGRVTDAAGAAVAGANINFSTSYTTGTSTTGTTTGTTSTTSPYTTPPTSPGLYANAMTGPDGSYSVTVYGGSYRVNIGLNGMNMMADSALAVNGNLTRDYTWKNPPMITGFTPTSGTAGTQVTIDGSGFGSTASGNSVNFSGMSAPIVSWSDSQIVVTVPNNAMTGNIAVLAQGANAWSSSPFNVIALPPQVMRTVPPANATGMPVNGGIMVGFDNQMDFSSINGQTFTIQDSSGASVAGTIQSGDNSYIFVPAANLNAGATYTATLSTGVRSNQGANLAAPYSWSFTTAATPTNTFTLSSGIFSLDTFRDSYAGITNYFYDFIKSQDGSHLTDSWYAYLNGQWSASTLQQNKNGYYALTDSGWTLATDDPTAGTITDNGDGSFTWTNSTDGSSQRMAPAEYNLSGQPLATYAEPKDLPAPPTGNFPDGSMGYLLRQTALTDSYRVGVWISDPSMPDQNYLRYNDSNYQQQTVTSLTDVPTIFATSQTMNYLYGVPNIGMQLAQDGTVQLFQFGSSQGQTLLSETGTWQYVTVKGQQLLVVHLPQDLQGSMNGGLFYAAVNGAVKQGEQTAAGTVRLDSHPNYNQTAFNWMIGATPVPTMMPQAITFPAPPAMTVGAGAMTISATGGASGNPVTFSSTTPSVCSVDGNSVTPLAAGTCTIAADQAGNTGYLAAPQVSQSVMIGKGGQKIGTVTFTPTTIDVGGTSQVTATGGASGNPVTFASLTPAVCRVSGNGVTGIAAGNCSITADQAGNASYNAAPQITLSAAVNATAPAAPTAVSAAASNGSAAVSFAPPTTNGGSAITGYTVSSIPAGGVDANAGTLATVHNVTGLSNGTSYSFTVTATNAKGSSAPSAASNQVTPSADIPGAPTAVNAVAGDASATVTFSAPASNGGSAILGYTVVSNPAGGIDSNADTLATSHTVTGLRNGIAYTFTVSARNSTGSGAPSAASNAAIPATVPGAPAAVSATVGNGHATVSFVPPASNGGSDITSYTVTSSPGNITASAAVAPIVVMGLTNGTTYSFTVTATNAKGTGPASAASNTVTPDTVPGAPTAVSAAGNNGSATVSFTAPAPNGASAVTAYTVTSYPGNLIATGATSPITLSGLANGTAYVFTVTASNSRGTGPASAPSNVTTPDVVPGAAGSVSASHGNGSATVSFSAPAPNGGTPVLRYTVTSSPDNISVSGLGSPISVSGLTNGTAYTFTVTATNAKGSGAASAASAPVTPSADVPGAPASVTASAGNGSATVAFTAPLSNGGSAITGYTVTSTPAGGVDVNAGTTGTIHQITGLRNGTTYTFTVTASNAAGTGAGSMPSNLVTPVTVPDAPSAVSATTDHGMASVGFSAPANNGGSAIIRYTVTASPGGITASAPASPITVMGLTDGVSYTFTVTATSAVGTGAPSAPSGAVTPADTIAPVVRSFIVPGSVGALDTSSSSALPISSLLATDNAAVTGYLVTSSSDRPSAAASGWSANVPASVQISSTPGVQIVYAWAKDAAGNVSSPYTAAVVVTPIDTTPPVVLSGPSVTSVSNNSAVIEWQTDEAAQGGVKYGDSYPLVSSVAETGYGTRHSVTVSGLAADATYLVSVYAVDHTGNGPTTSKVISLHTKPAPDTTAPYVTEGPTVTAAGPDSATIQWRTDEPAQGQVSYGTTNLLGSAAAESGFNTSHSVKITGLTAQTGYYFKVSATDIAGNGPRESGMSSFKTAALPDTTAPVVVEGPMVVNISDTGATVLWKTDEPSTSTVISYDGANYGFFSDNTLSNTHSITLTGLRGASSYSYKVSSTDGSGNTMTTGNFKTFSTLAAPDTTAPVIIQGPLVVNTTWQSAAIQWSSDEPADSVIEYGTSEDFGAAQSQSTLQRTHNLTLTGLESGTVYYFRVASTDAYGNGPTYSSTFTFTTEDDPSYKVPVVTVAPSVIYKTDTSMTVYWETDDPSDSVVEYGEGDQLTMRVSNGDMVNKHQITITNLKVNTAYKVVVSSTNMSGNTVYARSGSAHRFLAYALDSLYSDASGGTSLGSVTTAAQADTTPPVITVAPAVAGVTDHQATITWTTDEIADSQIGYGVQGGALALSAGDPSQVTSHVMVLTNLSASTQYQFTVSSTDPSGNGPTTSQSVTFTTAATPDTTPPSFTGNPALVISYQDGTGKTTIGWSTDEPATTQIRYGSSPTAMTSQAALPGLSQSHSLTLALQPGTTYYAAAVAIDSSGNVAQSAPLQFTTMGTLDVTEPATTTTPAAGSYLGAQSVTLSADKPSTIYYTTDGSTPSTSSPQYNGPIPLAASKTIKFFAIDAAGNKEVPKAAQFLIQQAITASSDTNGSITCPSAVNIGETGVCTVTPATGFQIASVNGCGGTLNGTSFTTGAITAECSVTASFTPLTFGVTPTVTGSGSISPATVQTVNYGTSSSFTVTPGAGYQVDSVTGCGGTLSGTTYTTGAVTGACTVTATFSLIPVTPATVNGDVNGDGTVDVADAILALKIAVGLMTPTSEQTARADVAPLVGGKPAPNGTVDISDVLLILQKAVGARQY